MFTQENLKDYYLNSLKGTVSMKLICNCRLFLASEEILLIYIETLYIFQNSSQCLLNFF